ncbi:MAG: hypothetical protein ACP5UT_11685 [Bryobacteraceae bacterium]
MTFTTREVVDTLVELLDGEGGLAHSLEHLKETYGQEPARPEAARIRILKGGTETVERASGARYPEVRVYCERIRSSPSEKLRRFSGEVRAVAEVRVSQDRLEGITERLQYYFDAVRDVLERRSGCIGPGLYLSGEYEVQVEPVKKGGSYFLQTARVLCTVLVNRS